MDWELGGKSVYFEDPDGHVGEIGSKGIWKHYWICLLSPCFVRTVFRLFIRYVNQFDIVIMKFKSQLSIACQPVMDHSHVELGFDVHKNLPVYAFIRPSTIHKDRHNPPGNEAISPVQNPWLSSPQIQALSLAFDKGTKRHPVGDIVWFIMSLIASLLDNAWWLVLCTALYLLAGEVSECEAHIVRCFDRYFLIEGGWL